MQIRMWTRLNQMAEKKKKKCGNKVGWKCVWNGITCERKDRYRKWAYRSWQKSRTRATLHCEIGQCEFMLAWLCYTSNDRVHAQNAFDWICTNPYRSFWNCRCHCQARTNDIHFFSRSSIGFDIALPRSTHTISFASPFEKYIYRLQFVNVAAYCSFAHTCLHSMIRCFDACACTNFRRLLAFFLFLMRVILVFTTLFTFS